MTSTSTESGSNVTGPPLLEFARSVESDTRVDHRVAMLDGISRRLADGGLSPLLRGDLVGHAVHPLLTDLPLGCWTSAMIIDLVGGRAGRVAARRLTGVGLLGVIPTALSGLVEFDGIDDQPTRRVAGVHAGANAVATAFQFLSWRSRRKDRHVRGVAWGLAGNAVAAISGYLGGHMAFARSTGTAVRTPEPVDRPLRDVDGPHGDRSTPFERPTIAGDATLSEPAPFTDHLSVP